MSTETVSHWGHHCELPDPTLIDPGTWFHCNECPERWLRGRTLFKRTPRWERCDWAW